MDDARPIALDEHAAFIENYANSPRIDFVLRCRETDDYVGGVNLAQTGHGLEIGKHVGNTNYLGMGIAKGSMISFLEYLKRWLPSGTEIVAKTKLENLANISLNKSMGFHAVQALPNDFILMRRTL